MADFRFEYTHQLSEAEHVALTSLLPQDPARRWINRAGLAAFGTVCLFSPYTLLLGVAVLGIGAVVLTLPRLAPFTAARTYRKLRYLHGPLTYGVSPERLWVRGGDFYAEAAWRHLAVWRHNGPWLTLAVTGMPSVLLPVAALREAGLYERVLELARAHAPEFDSAEARRAAV